MHSQAAEEQSLSEPRVFEAEAEPHYWGGCECVPMNFDGRITCLVSCVPVAIVRGTGIYLRLPSAAVPQYRSVSALSGDPG